MRSMTWCAGSLWLMVMCGCGGLSLDEMKAPGLLVQVGSSDDDFMEPYITLREIRENKDGEATQEGDCPELSGGARAFINDVEVPLQSPGGWSSGSFMGPAAHCSPTVFQAGETALPVPGAEAVTRVHITEGDQTFIAETRGLCAPRSLAMRAPADGVLRPGQEVELEWQPATDVLLVQRVTLYTGAGSAYPVSLQSETLQIEGNRMRFRVPQFLRATDVGAATLRLSADGDSDLYLPGLMRCEGFAECRFDCWVLRVPSSIAVTLQTH
jgi:hypothetical protein